MQIGSKVVCINDTFPPEVLAVYQQLPKKDSTYTIRECSLGREKLAVFKDGKIVKNGSSDQGNTVRILLVELKNQQDPFHGGHAELGFNAERFREVESTTEEEELAFSVPNFGNADFTNN